MRVCKGVVFALMLLTIVGGMPATAATPPSPTLTGEVLNASGAFSQPTIRTCDLQNNGTTTVTLIGGTANRHGYRGFTTATGPYPGTFTETITITSRTGGSGTFTADFTITSAAGTVVGTKTATSGVYSCEPTQNVHGDYVYGGVHVKQATAAYTTVLTPPSGPTSRDEGTSLVNVDALISPFEGGVPPLVTATETFTSSLAPTSKDQCQDGGYANFIDPSTGHPFKNQGQCIKYVNEHGGDGNDGNGNGGDGRNG